jgi:RNA polymerase sigma-70 factor, ECF subfamily
MNSADGNMLPNRTMKPLTAQRDAQLMSAVLAGSSDAFAEIQRLYSGHLYSTIVAITRNREDAEDALQDTFLRAYRALPNFEGRSSFYSWLTRIAINSALMLLRKRRARPEVSFDPSFESGEEIPQIEVRDPAPNPEQICDQRQRRAGMLRAIEKLEPRLRGAIQFRMAHGSSLKEIARALDISEAAVKARLYRARARLTAAGVFRNAGAKRLVASGSQREGAIPAIRTQEQQSTSSISDRSKQIETPAKFKGNFVPGAVVLACKNGHDGRQSKDRATAVAQVTRIYGDGNSDAGAANWGECGSVRRAERSAVATGKRASRAESLHGAALPVPVAIVSGLSGSPRPQPHV